MEYVAGDHVAGDDDHQESDKHNLEILLDRQLHRLAEEIDEYRDEAEADAARDDRQDQEQSDVHAGEAGRDQRRFRHP